MTSADPRLAPLVDRTRGVQPWRRVMHATTGVALAWLPWALGMTRPTLLSVLAAVSVALLLLDLARLRVPVLNRFAFTVLRPLISPREAEGLASSTWYAVGAFLTYALFPVSVAVPAILVLALADPAASVVGRLRGRRKLGKGTVRGAATFFVVALGVVVAALGVEPAAVARAVVVAAAATAVELLPLPTDDNLTVPLGTAAALRLALLVG